MPILKNPKQEKFVHNIIKGMNGGAAWTAAGYQSTGNVAEVQASKAMRKDAVKARYDELMGPEVKGITDIRDLARQYTAEAIELHAALMRNTKVQPSVRLAAAVVLIERGHGKAVQHIEAEVNLYDSLGFNDKIILLEALDALARDEESDPEGPV